MQSLQEQSPAYLPRVPKKNHNRPKAMVQLLDIQDALYSDATNPETTATARSLAARAFEALERLKRDMRMQPKPRPIDVQQKSRKPTGFSSPIERAHKSRPTPSPRAAENITEKNIAQAVPQPSTQVTPTNPPAQPREDRDSLTPSTPTTE